MAEEYLSARIKDVLLNTKDIIPSKLPELIKAATTNIKISTESLTLLEKEHTNVSSVRLYKLKMIKVLRNNESLINNNIFRTSLVEFLKEEEAWNNIIQGPPFTYNYSESLVPQLLQYIDHDHVKKLTTILD